MLFILKKWIGGLLMPLPLLLILFFIGLILLFFSKKQKTAKSLLLFTFILQFALSSLPVSDRIVRSVERKHSPIMQPAQNYEVILVLGSGGTADPSLPVTSQLSATALSRFMEALRVYHANPGATLVVSGSGFGDVKSQAQLMEELAILMKVPADKIIRLDHTLDTDDEARIMSKIIHGKKSVLVTSATHMDRALQLFDKYGGYPEADPTNFLVKNRIGETAAYSYIPSARYLDKTKVAWHEYLGQFQNNIKNLIRTIQSTYENYLKE